MPRPVTVKPDGVTALPRGTRFSVRLPKSLVWKDLHKVLYNTANREVILDMRDGSKVTGVLVETPGYFVRDQRLWLRVPGRKTRKGVKVRDIAKLTGYRSPTLAEALEAFIYVTASNPSEEQTAEARSVIADM